MASLNMAPEELKQLELLRNRLAQLTSSLSSLRASVVNSNPLPSCESIQASAAILQQNIRSLQELATENAHIFQRIAIHPSTNFPGRTQEHVLLQLLRKKLEPDVESWVEDAREKAQAAGLDASKLADGMRLRGEHDYDEDDTYGMDQEDDFPSDPFNEQWAEMRDAFHDTMHQYLTVRSKKKYTVEEESMGTENVRTGLKQSLEESDEEEETEDEEEEDEEEAAAAPGGPGPSVAGAGASLAVGAKPALLPEHLFWLAARGELNLPQNVLSASLNKATEPAKRPAPPR